MKTVEMTLDLGEAVTRALKEYSIDPATITVHFGPQDITIRVKLEPIE